MAARADTEEIPLARPVLGAEEEARVLERVPHDLTHRAVTSGERATVLSVQSLALRLCGSAGAFTAGRLASGLSMVWAWGLVVGVIAVGVVAATGLTKSSTPSLPDGR